MAEVLQAWLADAGVEASNLEQVRSWAPQLYHRPSPTVLNCSASSRYHFSYSQVGRRALDWQSEAQA
jgi:hypothetical protein